MHLGVHILETAHMFSQLKERPGWREARIVVKARELQSAELRSLDESSRNRSCFRLGEIFIDCC